MLFTETEIPELQLIKYEYVMTVANFAAHSVNYFSHANQQTSFLLKEKAKNPVGNGVNLSIDCDKTPGRTSAGYPASIGFSDNHGFTGRGSDA